jgi:hypothetical protein
MAHTIIEIEGERVREAGNGLPVGGVYKETRTRGSSRGVETMPFAEAAVELAGYRSQAERHGDAICIVTDEAEGAKVTVTLPGAIDLQYVYTLPI